MSTTADQTTQGATLELDSKGFLEQLVELRALFDDHIVNAERIVVDEKDTPQGKMVSTVLPPAPERLQDIAEELFGASCWPTEIHAAAEQGDTAFINHCRTFLTHCEYVVRRRGLGYWLYERMAHARAAFATDRPDDELPLLIRAFDRKRFEKRFKGHDKRRFGSKHQRFSDLFEYYRMMRSMASRCIMRWGAPGMQTSRVAYAVLNDGTIGGELLLEATTPCHRFKSEAERREHEDAIEIIHAIDGLRVQADAEYEQALARGDVHVSMPNRIIDDDDDVMHTAYQYFSYHVGIADVLDRAKRNEPWCQEDIERYMKVKPRVSACEQRIDKRFLYDAQQLRKAVEALWGTTVPMVDTIYESPQLREQEMQKPLWGNLMYIADVAASILGVMMRNQLLGALVTHDRDLIESSFRSLDSMCRMVRDIGVLAMPMLLIDEHEIDYEQLRGASKHEQTSMLRQYCIFRDAAVGVWLARSPWKDNAMMRDATLKLFGPSTLGFSRVMLPRLEQELAMPGTLGEAC
ncbi:hypothetical protein [Bifidobacterium criceti]|uniref:Riboflavin-specific deaminase n=1 Tax=Bifidobacterium criceti TaxID=1960969 RepID=A0A2A2EG66_9BIFI|nr:hypothetical protein [Bifidobacterium criceti]PAU67991.1 riboflavin-specific deaminase [Bifidobacterium criceti]